MTHIALRQQLPSKDWLWVTSDGLRLRPTKMKTTHLFYTLRMIWNHRMPPEMHVGENTRKWDLRRPDDYLGEAILRMGREVFTRKDLPGWMMRELREMAAHLEARPDLLGYTLRLGAPE